MTFDSHLSDSVTDVLIDQIATGAAGDPATRDAALDRVSDDDFRSFEDVIGTVALAFAVDESDPMPMSLRERCAEAARGALAAPIEVARPAVLAGGPLRFTPKSPAVPKRSSTGMLGWLAAAACLTFAAASWWPAAPASAASVEQQMATLVQTASDLKRWDWQAWDPSMEGVSGEVMWSEAAQEGYMVFAGLETNDPSQEQYQLWVVDASRGTPLEVPPVDGGVFNIAASGEVIVPIRCAVPARDVVAFAVTREPPGGVVVSDRTRKVVIAQPPAEG